LFCEEKTHTNKHGITRYTAEYSVGHLCNIDLSYIYTGGAQPKHPINNSASAMNLEEALDKVEARFIYNLPESELSHGERLFFQIEQAHWFYEDLLADNNPTLPHFKLKPFAELLFDHCLLLHPLKNELHILFDDFCSYRLQIPVCGCIMLNAEMTEAVLVRNWKGNSWSFPKGKINEGEPHYDCAIRETIEETGYNPSAYCNPEHFLVVYEEKKMTKLYVAIGVPEDTEFCPQTRKEISKVEFHNLTQLPKGVWGVHPFLPKLQRWIRKHRGSVTIPYNASAASSSASNAMKGGEEKKVEILSRKKTAPTPQRFDERNDDTFGRDTDGSSTQDKGWSVQDMFTTNSKLTGNSYTYDGNPHNFGDTHPRYVNFASEQPGGGARSLLESSGGADDISNLRVPLSTRYAEVRHVNATSGEGSDGKVPRDVDAVLTERRQYFPLGDFKFDVGQVMVAVDAVLPTTKKSSRNRKR
jgi:mRNA-decapping enzyme subunit 2